MGSPQGQQQRAQAAAPAAEQEVATPAGPPSGGAHAPAAAEREGQPASKRPRLEGQLSTGQLHVGEQLQLMAFPAPGQTPPAVDPSWVNAEGSFRVEACHPPSTAFLTLSLGGHQWKGEHRAWGWLPGGGSHDGGSTCETGALVQAAGRAAAARSRQRPLRRAPPILPATPACSSSLRSAAGMCCPS